MLLSPLASHSKQQAALFMGIDDLVKKIIHQRSISPHQRKRILKALRQLVHDLEPKTHGNRKKPRNRFWHKKLQRQGMVMRKALMQQLHRCQKDLYEEYCCEVVLPQPIMVDSSIHFTMKFVVTEAALCPAGDEMKVDVVASSHHTFEATFQQALCIASFQFVCMMWNAMRGVAREILKEAVEDIDNILDNIGSLLTMLYGTEPCSTRTMVPELWNRKGQTLEQWLAALEPDEELHVGLPSILRLPLCGFTVVAEICVHAETNPQHTSPVISSMISPSTAASKPSITISASSSSKVIV